MFQQDYLTAIIPAKGNSIGVPKKNLRLLLRKPIVIYTIEAAKKSKYIDNIGVATNSDDIVSLAKKAGVNYIKDPVEPAFNSFLDNLFEYNIKYLEKKGKKTDIALLLQPTSPLRNHKDIDAALEKFYAEKADSLLSVVNSHDFLWKEGENGAYSLNYDPLRRPVRQEMKQFSENGAIYIVKKDLLYANHCRLGRKIALYVMPDFKATQIDNETDFKMIEKIMGTEKENGKNN